MMSNFNALCVECEHKVPILVCRCTYPPAMLCIDCLAPHVTKNPQAQHSQVSISVNDLEEQKQAKNPDWHTAIKDINRQGLSSYRLKLQERIEKFRNERIQKVDQIMTALQKRADLLKQHITKEEQQALQAYDLFVQEFLSSNKYNFVIHVEDYLDFEQIVPVSLLAQSPLEGNIRDLFDLRTEISLILPENKPNRSKQHVGKPANNSNRSEPQPQLPQNSPKRSDQHMPKPPAPSDLQMLPFAKNKFETRSVREYFKFSNDDTTASVKKGQINGQSAVTVKQQYSEEYVMVIKFQFSDDGIFGLCQDKSATGRPGETDATGWMWSTYGDSSYQRKSWYKWNSGLGNMSWGKVIEMAYYGSQKKLEIKCEGKVNTQTNPSWPQTPYFVFSLWGGSVTLVED